MRRIIALIALLATAWPHAVVLECALRSPAGDEAAHHASHDRGRQPSGHDHAGGPLAHSDAGAPSGGSQCAMVMACGLAMIRTDGAVTAQPTAATPEAHPRPTLAPPVAADLVADTPPPRRHA